MIFQLLATADNKLGPINAEKAFASIHQALDRKSRVGLHFAIHNGQAGQFLQFDKRIAKPILESFHANYPHADLVKQSESLFTAAPNKLVLTAQLGMLREFFPLRSYREFEDLLDRQLNDPVSGLLNSLHDSTNATLATRVEIQIRSASNQHRLVAFRTIYRLGDSCLKRHRWLWDWFATWRCNPSIWKRMAAAVFALTFRLQKSGEVASELQPSLDKLHRHCFEAEIRIVVTADQATNLESIQRKLKQVAGSFGQFTRSGEATFRLGMPRRGLRWSKRRGFLLSDHEVATLFHPTTELVKNKRTRKSLSRQLEPPVVLPSPKDRHVVEVGESVFQNERHRFGISELDRLRHTYVVGKTGQGKSALLHRMIVDDIRKNRGVAVIDPHGDLADSLIQHIPSRRTKDLVLFDATDRKNPPAWQPLAIRNQDHKPIVAEELIAALKKVFDVDETNAPRMLYILRNAILALLDVPDATLLDLLEMLHDSNKRQNIMRCVQDDLVRSFWENEFEKQSPKVQREWVAPIENKIGSFLSSPLTRNILGQKRGLIDIREIMDNQQILIVNISKGKITENASRLLGTLLVAAIQAAAMSRAELPERDRKFFSVYVDEFQNVASESFSSILSEARKYRLALTVSHQYLGQLLLNLGNTSLRDAVFGNVGNVISFSLGNEDANYMAEHLDGEIKATDLSQLPKYHAFAKILNEGAPQGPFSIATLPPIRPPKVDRVEKIRRHSQRRFCRQTS